ncbi:MAG: carbamate kinase [Thermodesulfobacteriota bacterium]
MEKVIVSIGGNALIRRDESGTLEEQFQNAGAACSLVSRLLSEGFGVIITHGNGPVVGNIVIRNEAAKAFVPPMPLYISDADSEGGLGFMIQQTIYNEFKRAGITADVVTLVTQVVVDPADEAFTRPDKPVGPYYEEEEAESLQLTKGWALREVRNGGYRRVVPSPMPARIVESAVIKKLSSEGVVVIAAGGGGVPVVESIDGTLAGVDAVVDKDRSTTLLAVECGARSILNLTAIDSVYLGFEGPEQDRRPLRELRTEDAKRYLKQGEFAPGSMGPKVEAAIEFIERGGEEVIITTPSLISEAMRGIEGTRIF